MRESITPFARGLLGFTTRVPLWIFRANRPRAGKDYLAVMTILIYEGIAAEDSPIDRQSGGNRKAHHVGREKRAAISCTSQIAPGRLDDIHLTQAITNERITARRLGSNEASSDLSRSQHDGVLDLREHGLNYSEDIDERSRQIFLAYFEEEANGRKVQEPVSCTAPCANTAGKSSPQSRLFSGNGKLQGMPQRQGSLHDLPAMGGDRRRGHGRQTTWETRVCRSKMIPSTCRGDQKTEAMAAIYEVCHNVHGETWIRKDDLYSTIHKAIQDTEDNSGVEALGYFGPIKDHEKAQDNRKRLGYALTEYNFRILDGIRMEIDKSSANRGRHLYRFTKHAKTARIPLHRKIER